MAQNKNFHTYIDDSYSGGRILDKNFDKILISNDGLRPVINTGGLIIKQSKVRHANEKLHNLREVLRRELGIQDLPIIHMRHLWGARPPKDKGKNPFADVDFETRFKFARAAVELIQTLCANGDSFTISTIQSTSEIMESSFVFHNSSDGVLQNQKINGKFGKKSKEFYDIILNPLPRLIALDMGKAEMVTAALGGKNHFFYDSPESSKSFNVTESFEIARSINMLADTISVTGTSVSETPLLQLADVVSYLNHRKAAANRSGKADEGVDRLLAGIRWPQKTFPMSANSDARSKKIRAVAAMLHYELGVTELKKLDADWVSAHLLNPEDLMQRVLAASENTSGISLLR